MGSRTHGAPLTQAGSHTHPASLTHAGSLTRLVALLAVAGLVLALAGCGRKAAPERERSTPSSPAEQALVDLADRYADLDSFSARTQITETVSDAEGQETTTSQTEFYFRRPNRIFYEMTVAGASTIVIACNGKRLVVYHPAQRGYVEEDPPDSLAAFIRDYQTDRVGLDEFLLLSGGDPLEALADVSVADGEPIGDQPVQIIKGTAKQIAERGAGDPATATQSLYVGETDGLLHKVVTEIKRGEASLRTEEVFEQPAADPTIPDDRFDYQPPADADNLTQPPSPASPEGASAPLPAAHTAASASRAAPPLIHRRAHHHPRLRSYTVKCMTSGASSGCGAANRLASR